MRHSDRRYFVRLILFELVLLRLNVNLLAPVGNQLVVGCSALAAVIKDGFLVDHGGLVYFLRHLAGAQGRLSYASFASKLQVSV